MYACVRVVCMLCVCVCVRITTLERPLETKQKHVQQATCDGFYAYAFYQRIECMLWVCVDINVQEREVHVYDLEHRIAQTRELTCTKIHKIFHA